MSHFLTLQTLTSQCLGYIVNSLFNNWNPVRVKRPQDILLLFMYKNDMEKIEKYAFKMAQNGSAGILLFKNILGGDAPLMLTPPHSNPLSLGVRNTFNLLAMPPVDQLTVDLVDRS